MAASTWLTVINALGAGASRAEASDGELLECFLARRDEPAFLAIVQRHGPLVYGVCKRILRDPHATEDAFQATFLVLLRRAASLRRGGPLHGWLYRVAYRVAVRARALNGRLRSNVSGEFDLPVASTAHEHSSPELLAALDEEMQRLPEKYLQPLVLCYLQSKTHGEVARLLGWPRGSIAKRLSRGQEKLRAALARRGFALSLAGLASLGRLEAGLPTTLSRSTAALAVNAGGAHEIGAHSARALARGVVRDMTLHRVQIVVGLLTSMSLAVGAACLVAARSPGESPPSNELALFAPAPQEHSDEGTRFPRGIANADGTVGYVRMTEDAGIEALDLKTGAVLWQTKDAVFPLRLVGKRLLAFAIEKDKNAIRLVKLDVSKKGERAWASDQAVFDSPPLRLLQGWDVDTGGTRTRETSLIVVDVRDVYFEWHMHKHVFRGVPDVMAPPRPNDGKGLPKWRGPGQEGFMRAHLESGKVEQVTNHAKLDDKHDVAVLDSITSALLDKLHDTELPLSVQGDTSLFRDSDNKAFSVLSGDVVLGGTRFDLEGGAPKRLDDNGPLVNRLTAKDADSGRLIWERSYKEANRQVAYFGPRPP